MKKDGTFTNASATAAQPVTLATFEELKKKLDALPRIEQMPLFVCGTDSVRLWQLAKVQEVSPGAFPFHNSGAAVHISPILPDNFMVAGTDSGIYVFQVRDEKLVAYEVLPTTTLYDVYVELLKNYGWGAR